MTIINQFFGALLGIWAYLAFFKESSNWHYIVYCVLVIIFSSVIILILSFAIQRFKEGVSSFKTKAIIYGLLIIAAFLILTSLYTFQDLLLPESDHKPLAHLAIICLIAILWLLFGDLSLNIEKSYNKHLNKNI